MINNTATRAAGVRAGIERPYAIRAGRADRRADRRCCPVVVAGGGIAGLAAATGLAERGVPVILIEPQAQLGGRVRAWPVIMAASR